jgi:exodeoxyribonuclease-3
VRIVTLNVNGIRSAARKGLFDWLTRQRADMVCFQEVRAHAEQIVDRPFRPPSLNCRYAHAARAGYSGVGLLARRAPDAIIEGLGWSDMDPEARYLEARFGKLAVISAYLPSGTSGEARQAVKMDFLARFAEHLRTLRASGLEYIVCGDFNIAHKPIDLKNWRSNQKNSGFLPEERAWLDHVFDDLGFMDAFRVVNQQPDQYTWWSNRGQAWANNVGWRLDYQIVTPGLADAVRAAKIYTTKRFSDHAPLIMEYDVGVGEW